MQEQQSTINQDSSLWIGLDSYKESNSGIFFGRDEEIRQLSGDIFNNIQTVIYGPSGTGKTSIIRAGIFKIARANRYLPVYVRLNHKTDSKTYTQQIIDAIQDEAEKYSIDIEKTSPYIEENVLETADENSKKKKVSLSLWEFFHCNEFWNEENYPVIPLIVVDQFEEIFTLGKNLSLQPDFFVQLSDLCDNKYPQYVIDYLNDRKNERIEYPETINYRFVISLREDFLARLEEQAESIPALKRNRFSLQCINEEQALDIILKPQPGLVLEDVAALIIEKVTNKKYNKDFKFHDDPEILVEPAILSLFCRELDKKRREKDMPTLSSELIGEFGDNIIRDFYINSLSSLSEGNEENNSPLPTRDEKIDYLESRLITVDGFRDAVAYQNAKAFGFTKKDIQTLISNRLVRIDEWDGTRRIEFIHDVLCKVANKHRKEREQERENKKKEEEAKRLLEEEKAKREKIAREAEEEKERLKEEAIRIRRKNRRRLYGIALGMIVFGIIGFGVYLAKYMPYSEYYGNFTIVKGWPEGVGDELSNLEVRQKLIVHYRLTRTGWWPKDWGGNPFNKVEVIDADKKLCTNKFYEVPVVGLLETELDDVKAKAFADLQRKTAYWIFFPGGSGFDEEAARCVAYRKDTIELYSIQYYKDNTYVSQDSSKYVQWAVFNDANGKQMMVTDNGIDRMRQTIKNGVVTGCLFFTELGTPQKNAYGVYGYQYEVNDSNLIKRQCCVDKFGAVIDSTSIDYLEYEYGRIRKTSLYEVSYPQKRMIVYRFRDFNDTLTFNNNGTLGSGSFHTFGGKYAKVIFKYDKDEHPIKSEKYDNNQLVIAHDYFYSKESGKVDSISVYKDGERFVEKYAYPNDSTTIMEFWKDGKRHAMWKTNEFGDSLFYHKSIERLSVNSLYNTYSTEYKDDLNNPISREFGNYSDYQICYAKYSKSKDKNTNNIMLEYFYDSYGEICKSEWFEYDEYGNRIARAVAGIEGNPVRCDKWDWNNLCYYKMAFLRNFGNNVFVAVKGLNEYEEQSYIVETANNGHFLFELYELPLEELHKDLVTDNIRTRYFGLTIAQNNRTHYDIREVPYLHILNTKGTIYEAVPIKPHQPTENMRMKDGDIICGVGAWHLYDSPSLLKNEWNKIEKLGGDIELLKKSYDGYVVLNFHLNVGVMGAEYHYMPLTELEQKRIKNTN